MDKILHFGVIMALFVPRHSTQQNFGTFLTLATSGSKRPLNSPSSEVPLRKVFPFLALSLTLAGDGFETRGVIGQL